MLKRKQNVLPIEPAQTNAQVFGSIVGKLLDAVEEHKKLIQDLKDLSDGWAQAGRGAYYGESDEEAAKEEGRILGKEYCADELRDVLARYGVK
jgi:hypothetical protein